jgi:hypothetical protein
MRFNRLSTLILSVFMFALSTTAPAQKGDWQAVRSLAPGRRISVKAKVGHFSPRFTCDFTRATEELLSCYPAAPGFHPMTFERSKVKQVRLEHSDQTNAAVGALVGAGVGAALGASNGNGTTTRGGGAILGAGILGLIGGCMGPVFPITHGKVVYKK